MNKVLIILTSILLSFWGNSQYSIIAGGGPDFGLGTLIKGRTTLNLGLELPESEWHTMRLNATFFMPLSNINRGTMVAELRPEFTGQGNSVISVPITESIRQFALSYGRRNFAFNTYDDGLAFYFGSNTTLGMVTDILELGEYDQEKYYFPKGDVDPGKHYYRSFYFGIGMVAGMKYQLPSEWRSALTLELLGDYNIMIYDRANIYGTYVSPLNFGLKLGYRVDIF